MAGIEDKALRKSGLGDCSMQTFIHTADIFDEIVLANDKAYTVGLQG